jgi:glucose/arabinose dehydrogenase
MELSSRWVRRTSLGLVALLAATALGGSVIGASAPAEAAVVPSPGLPSSASADPRHVSLSFIRKAKGLDQPILVTSAPGTTRLFVVERTGRIRIYTSGRVLATPYLDLRSRVNSSGGEEGLLGLVFAPDFATSHKLWVTYTTGSGSLRLSRFVASSVSATTVNAYGEKVLLTVPHPKYKNHNAGMLVFGRDGYLYLSTGDGGGSGDPSRHAQDRTSLNGKLLRIDARHSCGSKLYCIPASNPYAHSTKYRREIWAYGLRNAWRFSVDSASGDLWVADVGQNRYEEVTRIPYGKKGWNLGWSCYEGRHVYAAGRCSPSATYHAPTIEYPHPVGEAIIGGFVYRGTAYATALHGLYVYGDYITGRVWVYGRGVSRQVASVGAGRLTAFGQSQHGELYAVTIDGGLYALRATSA